MTINEEIQQDLLANADESYKNFHSSLIPNIDKSTLIGVRTPVLRKLSKKFAVREDIGDFLSATPHTYYDENLMHVFILDRIKDFDKCIACYESFFPYIDNWAVCDLASPKCFSKAPEKLVPYILKWINSGETYTIRFAINMLIKYFLDERYSKELSDAVAEIESEEYYVKMAVAWYFATALAKQYDTAIEFIKQKRLDKFTHNKSIQKAIESRRVTDTHKDYLRKLKIR